MCIQVIINIALYQPVYTAGTLAVLTVVPVPMGAARAGATRASRAPPRAVTPRAEPYRTRGTRPHLAPTRSSDHSVKRKMNRK